MRCVKGFPAWLLATQNMSFFRQKCIESGKLKWDTTLGEVLGDLPMKDGYKAVTIEQIMHHRGGVPEDPGMRRPDVVRIVAGETDAIKIRQNYAKDILQRDLIAKPGQRFADRTRP